MINSNQIINFEVGKLQKLSYNASHIESIENGCFEIFNRLEVLDLSNNQLTKINECDFSHLINLKHLNISNNAIKTIHSDSFLNLEKLESLSLGFNFIEKIESNLFKNSTSLKHLDLRTWKNGEIFFIENTCKFQEKFHNLQMLECSFKIFHHHFESLKNLNYLKIVENEEYFMRRELVDSLPNLKRISIETDELNKSTIEFLRKLTSLEELEIEIKSKKTIKLNIFKNLKKFKIRATKLSLSNTNVDTVYKNLMEFCYCGSFLESSEFIFDFNKILNITELCLENLKLVTSLKTLESLTCLESLKFKNVEFKDLNFFCKILNKLVNLRIIKLNCCKFNEQYLIINDVQKSAVKELHLDFNVFSNLNAISTSFYSTEILSLK